MTEQEKKRRQYQSDLARLKRIPNKTPSVLKHIEEIELSLQMLRTKRTKHLIKT